MEKNLLEEYARFRSIKWTKALKNKSNKKDTINNIKYFLKCMVKPIQEKGQSSPGFIWLLKII